MSFRSYLKLPHPGQSASLRSAYLLNGLCLMEKSNAPVTIPTPCGKIVDQPSISNQRMITTYAKNPTVENSRRSNLFAITELSTEQNKTAPTKS
jgi:hypothetical protein